MKRSYWMTQSDLDEIERTQRIIGVICWVLCAIAVIVTIGVWCAALGLI